MMTQPAQDYIPEVIAQYEEFPYPHRNPEHEKIRLLSGGLGRLDSVNHNCFRGTQDFHNFRVLIAGGGTGDGLILWAEQLRDRHNSEVVYIDFSEASAKIAKERAKIRGLENITWIHDSLLNLPDLDLGTFDFIDCNGVLHHLTDPDAGLNALKSVLNPEGAMNLMVYAPYGRTGIYQMQNLMRLVNGDEQDSRIRIAETKGILESLPETHWIKVTEKLGMKNSDLNNDAGVHDLFLHAKDRAFTILEVHEFLDKCGLKMPGEPGSNNTQVQYLPETFIKNKDLLKKIKSYPKKIQQNIGEALSTALNMHEFHAVLKHRENPTAEVTDTHLVPWGGMAQIAPFEILAQASEEHNRLITLTFHELPMKPQISIPQGKSISSILRHIDGKRTIKRIIDCVIKDPAFKKRPPSEMTIMADFEELLIHLNRSHTCFLRDNNLQDYPTLNEIQGRMKKK